MDRCDQVAGHSEEDGRVTRRFLAPPMHGVHECLRRWMEEGIELHIEKGPELEATSTDIGIVTAIAAPSTYTFEVIGQGGHAGAMLMPGSRDALCAAAKVVLAIEYLAKKSASPDSVATVGQLKVHPGASHSIPSQVRFSLDLCDTDVANRDELLLQAIAWAGRIAKQRDVDIRHLCLNSDPPAVSSPKIVAAVEEACERRQCSCSHA